MTSLRGPERRGRATTTLHTAMMGRFDAITALASLNGNEINAVKAVLVERLNDLPREERPAVQSVRVHVLALGLEPRDLAAQGPEIGAVVCLRRHESRDQGTCDEPREQKSDLLFQASPSMDRRLGSGHLRNPAAPRQHPSPEMTRSD